MANKISSMGLSGVKIFPIIEQGDSTSLPTYGTAINVPYAVNVSLTPQVGETAIYSDNQQQALFVGSVSYTGSLEFGVLPKEFYTQIYGWLEGENGEMVEVADAKIKEFAITLEFNTNDRPIRLQLYRVKAKPAAVNAATQTDSLDPQATTFEITALPRSKDQRTRIKMVQPDNTDTDATAKWNEFNTGVVELSTSS